MSSFGILCRIPLPPKKIMQKFQRAFFAPTKDSKKFFESFVGTKKRTATRSPTGRQMMKLFKFRPYLWKPITQPMLISIHANLFCDLEELENFSEPLPSLSAKSSKIWYFLELA